MFGKAKLTDEQLKSYKDSIYTDIHSDVNNLVHKMITEYATRIDVHTVLATQRDKFAADKLTDELLDIKNIVNQHNSNFKQVTNQIGEINKRFPRIENEVGNLKMDVSSKTSRDEMNMIKNAFPTLVTRQELDEVRDRNKEFISKKDLMEFKKDVVKIQESLQN